MTQELSAAVIGFVVAWATFELSEYRRRRIHKRNIRKSLFGELRLLEVILNSTVLRFSCGIDDPGTAVAEFRWFCNSGHKQWALPELGDDEYQARGDQTLTNQQR